MKDKSTILAEHETLTVQQMRKWGRNKPCFCKSGIKYKKCCLDGLERPIRNPNPNPNPKPKKPLSRADKNKLTIFATMALAMAEDAAERFKPLEDVGVKKYYNKGLKYNNK